MRVHGGNSICLPCMNIQEKGASSFAFICCMYSLIFFFPHDTSVYFSCSFSLCFAPSSVLLCRVGRRKRNVVGRVLELPTLPLRLLSNLDLFFLSCAPAVLLSLSQMRVLFFFPVCVLPSSYTHPRRVHFVRGARAANWFVFDSVAP